MKTLRKAWISAVLVLLLAALPVLQVSAVPFNTPERPTDRHFSDLPPDIFDTPCTGGASCPGRRFTDMPGVNHWSHNPIDWAVSHGVTAGTGENAFEPQRICTRAQIVVFLWRAYGSQSPEITTCPFKDVNPDSYYYTAMLWAYGRGISAGTSATTFSPNMSCTRAQIVTFLWAAAGKPMPGTQISPFYDVSPNRNYYDAVRWAAQNKITSGVSFLRFQPNGACTREQVVTFLYRLSRLG